MLSVPLATLYTRLYALFVASVQLKQELILLPQLDRLLLTSCNHENWLMMQRVQFVS